MRKASLFLALVVLTIFLSDSARAQGTIQFLNTSLQKLKFCQNNVAVDCPAGVVVGVFWGYSRDTLALALPTVVVQTAGLFNGGAAYPLAGSNPGEVVYLKIAGWYNRSGPTPLVAAQGPLTPGITDWGESAVVSVALGPTTGPGTVVFQSATATNPDRAKPFIIGPLLPCPEPSVFALGAVGLGLWVILRRRTG
jgi:hypothetical protein